MDENSEQSEDATPADAPIETDVRDSNPNADSAVGLAGDMGISSERTGPDSGRESATTGIEGTGSVGSSMGGTDGTADTTPGPLPDEAQPDDQPDDRPDDQSGDDEDNTASTGIDRTVGEHNPAEVPKHDFDPKRNPGHSGG